MYQQTYNQSRPEGRPHLRRKALLIGINYEGQKAALQGCRQDVRNMVNTPSPRPFFMSAGACVTCAADNAE